MNDRAVETAFVFDRHAAADLSVAYAILVPQRRARIRAGQEGRPPRDERGDLCPGVECPAEEGPDDRVADRVNVLGGAPFGYRYINKTADSGAGYEIIGHEAAIAAELFRRYTDDGASIADLTRWLTSENVPTRTGKARWDRSVV